MQWLSIRPVPDQAGAGWRPRTSRPGRRNTLLGWLVSQTVADNNLCTGLCKTLGAFIGSVGKRAHLMAPFEQ